MDKTNEVIKNKRYTIATRDVNFEALTIAGGFSALMIVWACLTTDERLIFIPLIFLTISFGAFILLLFRYITEPKIAIQADCNGIYFYFRNKKEVYIDYNDIVEVLAVGVRNKYGRILIKTESNEYKSVRTYELKDKLLGLIRNLLNAKNREEYLIKNEIKKRSKNSNS